VRVLDLQGSPREIGRAYGEALRGDIHELYRRRLANAIGQAKTYGGRDVGEEAVLRLARACFGVTEAYDPSGFEETRGIAEGAGLSVEQIVAMNGLTDFRDVLAWGGDLESLGGCTAFIVHRDRGASGQLWAGQTWDLATDNMSFVVIVRRRPSDGPRTWSLTTAGCLSLVGLNEDGVCIGTTNVRTTDARIGVHYLAIIHAALRERELDAAIARIVDAPRAGAHFYYVAQRGKDAAAIECTATRADVARITHGSYVHTNHCLVPEFRAIEASTPHASSHARFERMSALLSQHDAPLGFDALRGFLSDREHGENAISRVDFGGISSNGAVIMSPDGPSLWACHGVPHEATWFDAMSAPAR
jgi:isopenicillin-N N-acyltransferase-like protein